MCYGKRVRRSESRHEIESGLGSTTRISRSRGASDLKPKLSMFYGIGHSHCRSLINTCNRPPSPFTQRRETESHLMAATSSRCLSMNDSLRGSCPTTTIQDPSSHRSKLLRKWVTQLPWLVFAIVINLTAWTHMWNSPVNEDFNSDVWSLFLCTDIHSSRMQLPNQYWVTRFRIYFGTVKMG